MLINKAVFCLAAGFFGYGETVEDAFPDQGNTASHDGQTTLDDGALGVQGQLGSGQRAGDPDKGFEGRAGAYPQPSLGDGVKGQEQFFTAQVNLGFADDSKLAGDQGSERIALEFAVLYLREQGQTSNLGVVLLLA